MSANPPTIHTDFGLPERAALAALLELSIREDLGRCGDVTGQATIPLNRTGRCAFVARQGGILAGLPALKRILERIAPTTNCETLMQDGQELQAGYWIATVRGPVRDILSAERIALNFLQRMSGVASLTNAFVRAVAGASARILDTRKTIPGWRLLDKYAVRQGGGHNHRLGLFDAILIKDNHLAALGDASANAIEIAVRSCREAYPKLAVEIEVDNLDHFERALRCQPEIILLDNLDLGTMREAVHRRNERAPAVLLEASGGVNLDTVRGIAESGVDRISIGALTHSAPALDIALDFVDG